jgi:ligand-binding SRPBCC domain-containing protein
MIHHERSLTIDAAPDAVWAVLSRYMHIDEFAPQITSVDALTDGEAGVGSKRRNGIVKLIR